MFVHRNVYETRIGDFLFKANDTKGLIEIFDKNNEMVGFVRKAPESYQQFQVMAHELYDEMKIGGLFF
ncbi:hypothetical protein [Clostridium ganghwense]|uniref:Uncharacterized protein n=1 Tax=Clostridium ganghwense TaxID=312089 RepID=A0ABT4CR24_9CLOT|nr:hypothetical protein [Clostridium ganghwense]MCY6371373.1 hypothetical protein [Clostridium ganghwense]